MDTRIDKRGYEVLKKTTRNCRMIRYHVVVAESFFRGPMPEGNEIHHRDEDKLNNEPWNLMVCSQTQHKIIHRRLRAKAACGNSNWRKCGYCGEYDAPENLGVKKNSIYHKKCVNAYERARYWKKKEAGDVRETY